MINWHVHAWNDYIYWLKMEEKYNPELNSDAKSFRFLSVAPTFFAG